MSAPVLLTRQEGQESRELLGFEPLLRREHAAPCLAHRRCVVTGYGVDVCSTHRWLLGEQRCVEKEVQPEMGRRRFCRGIGLIRMCCKIGGVSGGALSWVHCCQTPVYERSRISPG